MSKKFGKKEFIVDGKPVVVDMDMDFEIDDIDDGMRKIASWIAYFGSVLAAAKHEENMVTAYYRNWKARRAADALLDDPKMAQWKITVSIESSDEFLEWKDKQAVAGRNVDGLYWVVNAYRSKSGQLQSLGAMSRAAFEATDMSTKEHPGRPFKTDGEKAVEEEGRRDTVRGAIQKTKSIE